MVQGGISNTINMLDPINIEVDKVLGKITFGQRENTLDINLSKENFQELIHKLSPDGVMPDDFHKQIHMMNQLIEELEDIQDKNDHDWELDKVYYDEEHDTVFFDCKEVE
jgi:hypothetical protein